VPITQIVAKPPQARDKVKIAALMSDIEKTRNAKAKADRKGEARGPVPQVSVGSYVPGVPDVFGSGAVDWVANHDILLPMDARVIPGSVLPQMRAGKFERGIVRKLPQCLPKGAAVLEIGAAMGFVGLYLSKARPDLDVLMQEDNPALRVMMARVMAQNGIGFSGRLALSEAVLGDDPGQVILRLAEAHKPEAVLLADARLSPEVLQALLAGLTPQPRQVYLYGRLLETWHGQMDQVAQMLAALGFAPAFKFDPNLVRGFERRAQSGS